MTDLYTRLESTKMEDFSLDSQLLRLLEPGFTQAHGAILLKTLEKLAKNVRPESFPDVTGYECFVNHIHVEDHICDIKPGSDTPTSLKEGFVFSHKILEKLSVSFPDKPFTLILAFSQSGCSIRFHSTRSGEQWLSNELDKYDQEALLVLETAPSSPGDNNAVRG